MFTYNKEKDLFIHWPSSFILAGDYVRIADNDEIRNKFYKIAGLVLDDYSIGMMRARRSEAIYS